MGVGSWLREGRHGVRLEKVLLVTNMVVVAEVLMADGQIKPTVE